ncbi:ABC transporter ATP-binding protein/permease wht-1-like [Saccoglossus kowalevskii]
MDFSEVRAWPDSESDYEREYREELPLRSTYFTQQHFEDSGTSEVVIRQAGNIPNQFTESETAFTNGDCFRFRSPSPSTIFSDAAIALTWTGITVTPVQHTYSSYEPFYSRKLVNSRQLLRGVNGYAKVGRVLAVLGASGSGKSTLLDTLTFRSDGNLSVQGNIMANGEPVDSSITSVMAYVQQDEFFITKLTVREHLQFQAALRMNSEYHFHSKLEKVENLLVELDLIDCADTLIGQPHCNGITLCERKKLSIASELLTNQPVIFYDEPTHGLDADAAMDIIQTLKGFASIGHTVICTFRKTSSQLYGLFDNIMLLADGRCVYFGSPSQAIHFFSTMGYTCPPYYCPADYFLHILATLPDSIEELCKSFDNSSFGSKAYETRQDETFKARVRRSSSVRDRLQKIKYYNTDWCTQFANLLWRNFVAMKRSIFLFHVHFLHLVVSIALLYYSIIICVPPPCPSTSTSTLSLNQYLHPVPQPVPPPCPSTSTSTLSLNQYLHPIHQPVPSSCPSTSTSTLSLNQYLHPIHQPVPSSYPSTSTFILSLNQYLHPVPQPVPPPCPSTNTSTLSLNQYLHPVPQPVPPPCPSTSTSTLSLNQYLYTIPQPVPLHYHSTSTFILSLNQLLQYLHPVPQPVPPPCPSTSTSTLSLNQYLYPIPQPVIREELPLIVYENKIGLYRFDSYLIARYMAQLPSSILYPIVSSTIVYWMTGLNPGWRNYFVFVGIIILVTNAGASFGLFLSVLTSSQNVIIIISMIFILPVLTMGGYFINIASSPVYLEWLEYFSWYKYAFEALSINQWKDLDAKGCNYSIKVQCMESGENVLKQLSIDQDNLLFDFVALAALCIGFQILSLVVLLLKRYDKYRPV